MTLTVSEIMEQLKDCDEEAPVVMILPDDETQYSIDHVWNVAAEGAGAVAICAYPETLEDDEK